MTRVILVAVVLSAVISTLVTTGVFYFVLWRGGASIEQVKGEQVVRKQRLPKAANDAQTLGEDADHIELDELIKLYMLPAGVSYTVLGWDTGSAPGTPISWEHVGTKECEAYREKEFGTPYCRTGSVVITVYGKPTYTVLGKTVEPGRWEITMMGGMTVGAYYVSLDCNCLSRELAAPLGETASQTDGLKVTSLRNCGYATYSSELFRVSSSGKQPAFVRETWSCGATGCPASAPMGLIEVFA